MRKIIIIVLCLIIIPAVYVIADEQSVQERAIAINTKITQTLPAKKAALDTKIYTGTFVDIMTQRVADLNEVTLEAKNIVVEVNELCVLTNTPQPPKEAIINAAKRTTDVNDIKQKEQNANFIKALHEDVTDSNITDPCEIAAGQALLEWSIDIINSEMGGM